MHCFRPALAVASTLEALSQCHAPRITVRALEGLVRHLSSGPASVQEEHPFVSAYVINVEGHRATAPVVLGLLDLLASRCKSYGYFQVRPEAQTLPGLCL